MTCVFPCPQRTQVGAFPPGNVPARKRWLPATQSLPLGLSALLLQTPRAPATLRAHFLLKSICFDPAMPVSFLHPFLASQLPLLSPTRVTGIPTHSAQSPAVTALWKLEHIRASVLLPTRQHPHWLQPYFVHHSLWEHAGNDETVYVLSFKETYCKCHL